MANAVNLNGITREFVTITGAGKMFGVNRLTVYKWIKNGLIPAKRLGTKYFIKLEDIRDMQKGNMQQANSLTANVTK